MLNQQEKRNLVLGRKFHNPVEMSVILRGKQDCSADEDSTEPLTWLCTKPSMEAQLSFLLSEPNRTGLERAPFFFFLRKTEIIHFSKFNVWSVTVRYLSGAGND